MQLFWRLFSEKIWSEKINETFHFFQKIAAAELPAKKEDRV